MYISGNVFLLLEMVVIPVSLGVWLYHVTPRTAKFIGDLLKPATAIIGFTFVGEHEKYCIELIICFYTKYIDRCLKDPIIVKYQTSKSGNYQHYGILLNLKY